MVEKLIRKTLLKNVMISVSLMPKVASCLKHALTRQFVFEDGEVVVSTDTAYQEVISEIYDVPAMNLLTYEGTEEEAQRAKELVVKATNTPWPFEDESSDDDDEGIQYLEPPTTMTCVEMEFYADSTTDVGLEFYPVNATQLAIVAF